MVNRTLEELGKFINEEYGGVIAERGTPYPCNQQQIDLYTLQPYCHQGNHLVMSEHNAISMLEDFLDRSRPPTPSVSAALHRIKDAINIKDDWYPDVVLKAAYDIDTAFFMGRLKGNVRIMWVNRIRMVEQYGSSMAYMLGHTHYLGHGCSSVWLSMQDILLESEFPRTKMWKVVFHELIVSLAVVFTLNGDNMLTYKTSTLFASQCATIHTSLPTTMPKAGVAAMATCFVDAFAQSKTGLKHTLRGYVLLLPKISQTSMRLCSLECHEISSMDA